MTQGHSNSPATQEAVSQPPAALNAPQDLDFLDLLIMVAQRKRFVALMTALGTLVALAIALALPSEYTATVVLLPPRGNAFVNPAPPTDNLDEKNPTTEKKENASPPVNLNEMYASLLKSRPVEEAVIQRYGLMAEYHKSYLVDARKSLEAHARIDGSTRDGLMRLNFSSRNPNRAAEIANGYVEQFRVASQHLVIPEAGNVPLQVVELAVPPEKKSYPNRVLMTLAGSAVGLTFGLMLALLEGGLVRLQSDPAARNKLEQLKSHLSVRRTKKPEDKAEIGHLSTRPGTSAL